MEFYKKEEGRGKKEEGRCNKINGFYQECQWGATRVL
jgi:hypothetical protein